MLRVSDEVVVEWLFLRRGRGAEETVYVEPAGLDEMERMRTLLEAGLVPE